MGSMAKHQALKIGSVDLVVFGATTGAVAAALAANDEGARVFVVSDRAYFGEESAGAFELGTCGGDRGVPSPGAVKHDLEKTLLAREIPFLFMVRPVAVTPAKGGGFDVILAHRTALYALETKGIVDASRHGLVLNCAGAQATASHKERRPAAKTVSTMLVGMNELTFPGLEPVGERFEVDGLKTGQSLQVYRHRQPAPEPVASVAGMAAQELALRSPFLHRNIVYTADAQRFEYDIAEGAEDVSLLADEAFNGGRGIWVFGNTLPLNGAGLNRLNDPAVQDGVGRRVGALAAREVLREGGTTEATETGSRDERGYRFAAPFYRESSETLEFEFPEQPLLAECDVLVAGGGTGGAPAGIAAARKGAKTIVLEQQRGLGGVGTLGQICSYYYGLLIGFTGEMVEAMAEIDPSYGNSERQARWNAEVKMAWLLRELNAAGGEAWLGSFAFGVEMEGERVAGVLVSTPFGSGLVRATTVVDASGSADLAAAAGAPCRVIDGGHCAVQGTGLSQRRPGHHYLNSDFDFIDDNDPHGVTHAFVNARAKFKGDFDTIPFINSRERRQIIGDVELSPLDLLGDRVFPDTVAMAMSNFDSHGFTVHPMFLTVPPDREKIQCAVPFRAFLPQGISNMLVTGLGMSAHRDALPVVRMQADVQNHGYSAGVAASMAARLAEADRGRMRAVDIPALQAELVETGILQPDEAGQSDSFPLPADVIRDAAWKTPLDLFSTAVLFAHPAESRAQLLKVLSETTSAEQREEVALVLGLQGCSEAAPVLIDAIGSRGWDEGWNYRGMGQFGMSTSRMDALIIALGVVQAPHGVPVLLKKIAALREQGAESELSHCRAVAIAAGLYGENAELAGALEQLLEVPGIRGHAITTTQQAVAAANPDKIETAPRNLSLREIALAKGLYLAGDPNGIGKATLQQYARDLRGLFARHAAAILAARTPEELEALKVAC